VRVTTSQGRVSGGAADRIKAQFKPSKKGCCLISAAPLNDPSLFSGSFTSKPLIRSLALLLTDGFSGNLRFCETTFANVSSFPGPLKGVLPYNSS
ncbi:Os12g0480250, partial [Oryza sativa Japonica Group]